MPCFGGGGVRLRKDLHEEAGLNPASRTNGRQQMYPDGHYRSLICEANGFLELVGALERCFCDFGGQLWVKYPVLFAGGAVSSIIVIVIGVVHFLFYLLGSTSGTMLGLCCSVPALLWSAYLWGLLDNAADVSRVRMQQIKFTLPEGALQRMKEEQLWMLKSLHGKRLDEIVRQNKLIGERWGGFARASPVRAVPVLVDTSCAHDRFWALEMDRVIRYSLQGHSEIWVRHVNPQLLSEKVSGDLARWQRLRARVARVARNDVAKRLQLVELRFEYPDFEADGKINQLTLCFVCPVSMRTTTRTKCVSIEDLERQFEPLVEAALQKKTRSSFSRNGHAACVDDGAIHGDSLAPSLGQSPSREMGVEDGADDEEGLCVVCLEARAEMVMRACGHLVFCTRCRRRIVALAKGVRNAKELSTKHIEKTGTACPICRKTSLTIRRSSYDRKIYTQ